MPKKKTKGGALSSKAALLVVGVAAVLVIGSAVILSSTDKNGSSGIGEISEDVRAAVAAWIEQMNDFKNEPMGCCLPQCQEYNRSECQQRAGATWVGSACSEVDECRLGCCQIDCIVKENFPQASCVEPGVWSPGGCEIGCCHSEAGSKEVPEKTCLECTANSSWEKGKCGTGYYVNMESTYNTTIAGKPFTQTIVIDMHTCSDSVFSLWSGTEKYTTNGSTRSIPIAVDLTEGFYEKSTAVAGAGYEVSVTENKMTMTMGASLFNINYSHNFEGYIRQGAPECQKRL